MKNWGTFAMTENNISLCVNGETLLVQTGTLTSLLNVLREDLGLTGSKDGCSSGDCGACVVMLDGTLVNSCMVLAAQADGANIMTIEGLASHGSGNDELHPLQRAFAKTWAFQCGFCTQGMLISCFALLEANLNPSREEILTAISGNFCRCTGYQNVVKSVQLAAAQLRSTDSSGHSDND
jgi:carbon-monoxide dehydrogenase small subunit